MLFRGGLFPPKKWFFSTGRPYGVMHRRFLVRLRRYRPSKMAFLARFANYRVEMVSDCAESEGETQIIIVILAFPLRESLSTLVSFELRKGICVRFTSCNAEMQYPRVERDLFIEVSSWILISFSFGGILCGILNFSDPARSTIRSLEI